MQCILLKFTKSAHGGASWRVAVRAFRRARDAASAGEMDRPHAANGHGAPIGRFVGVHSAVLGRRRGRGRGSGGGHAGSSHPEEGKQWQTLRRVRRIRQVPDGVAAEHSADQRAFESRASRRNVPLCPEERGFDIHPSPPAVLPGRHAGFPSGDRFAVSGAEPIRRSRRRHRAADQPVGEGDRHAHPRSNEVFRRAAGDECAGACVGAFAVSDSCRTPQRRRYRGGAAPEGCPRSGAARRAFRPGRLGRAARSAARKRSYVRSIAEDRSRYSRRRGGLLPGTRWVRRSTGT